jgi:L-seryl-tRNA(Ser) seleniumtransferase
MSPSADLKNIPSVDDILTHPRIRILVTPRNRIFLVSWIRKLQLELRAEYSKAPRIPGRETLKKTMVTALLKTVDHLRTPSVSRVINATGIVLHTNLGRAVIGTKTLDYIRPVFSGYSTIEYNLKTGKRGKRQDLLVNLLTLLSGAEDALVVNNNAAAILLVLESLAKRKEVIVSRGELIEIGGSFRIPDIMKKSGARLVEVGTTNKTRLRDYERAIGPKTALILSVHPSNFAIKGFSAAVGLSELSGLCKKHGLPLVRDLGSGALFKIPGMSEPTVSETLKHGADLACFSGDKLMGGPQSGIIVGKEEYLQKLKSNSLFRALRVDKVIYSAMEHLLLTYLFDPDYNENITTLKMLTGSNRDLGKLAKNIVESLKKARALDMEIIETRAYSGGGSQPDAAIKSIGLKVSHAKHSSTAVASVLRQNQIPIIGRIHEGSFIIDMRTLMPDDDREIVKALKKI